MRPSRILFVLAGLWAGGWGAGCGETTANGGADLSTASVQDMATASDAASVPVDLLGPSGDAGSVIGIACGDTPCAANAQFCCTSNQGKTGLCGFGNAADCASAVFYCDGPEDCPPAEPYCCVQNGTATCVSSACGGTIQAGFGMCHTDDDCSLVGGTCCASSNGGPYRLCIPMGCP